MRYSFLASILIIGGMGPISAFAQQVTPFSANSGSVNVDCEQWARATADYQVPTGYRIASVFGRWVDLSNITDSNQEIVNEGYVVHAKGAIRGLGKQSVFGAMNCPGGGHGTLEVYGTIVHE